MNLAIESRGDCTNTTNMPATPSKKILILGATGVVGKVLTDSLLNAKGTFERVGVFTSAESATAKKELLDGYKARGAEVLTGDIYDDDAVLEAYKG